MTQRITKSTTKALGRLVAVAIATGAFAVAAMGSAPAAKADCASFFGIGNSAHCQSNLTSIAIAIGPNATAIASGLFGVAFATNTNLLGDSTGAGVAKAEATGAFDFGLASGGVVTADAGGVFGESLQFGYSGQTTTEGFFNAAEGVTNPMGAPLGTPTYTTLASGLGNYIVNAVFADEPGHSAKAVGIANSLFNGLGVDDDVEADGIGNLAFAMFSQHSTVKAGPGPLAIAVSIGQLTGGQTIQTGPGIKIGLPPKQAQSQIQEASYGGHSPAVPTAAVGTKKAHAAPAATKRASTK